MTNTMDVLVLMNSFSATVEREDYEEYERTGVPPGRMLLALAAALNDHGASTLIDSIEPLFTGE